MTSSNQPPDYHKRVVLFSYYYQIFIIIVGFIGNSLTIVIFWRTKLTHTRKTSFYLIFLAANDIGVLVTVLLKILDQKEKLVTISRFNYVCKTLNYLHFVFNFISCSIVLTFTVHRLISICFPLRVHSSNLLRRSKLLFILLLFFGFLFYTYVLYMFEVRDPDGDGRLTCTAKKGYADTFEQINFVDSLFTLIIPVLGLLVMNAIIIRTLKNSNYNFIIRTSSNRHFSYEPPNNTCAQQQQQQNQQQAALNAANDQIHLAANAGVQAGLGLVMGHDHDHQTAAQNSEQRKNIKSKRASILKMPKTLPNENYQTAAGGATTSGNNSQEVSKNKSSGGGEEAAASGDENFKFIDTKERSPSLKYKTSNSNNNNSKNHDMSTVVGQNNFKARSDSSVFIDKNRMDELKAENKRKKCKCFSMAKLLDHKSSDPTAAVNGGGGEDHLKYNHETTTSTTDSDYCNLCCSCHQKGGRKKGQGQAGRGSFFHKSGKNRNVKSLSSVEQETEAMMAAAVASAAGSPRVKRGQSRLSVLFEMPILGRNRRSNLKKNSQDHFDNHHHHNNNNNNNNNKSRNGSLNNAAVGHRGDHTIAAATKRAIRMSELNNSSRALDSRTSFKIGGRQNKSVSRKITKMLILVSTTFLLLNLPIHSFNVLMHIRIILAKNATASAATMTTINPMNLMKFNVNNNNNSTSAAATEKVADNQVEKGKDDKNSESEYRYTYLEDSIRELCEIIFYTSFSVNFLLYSISGVTFRTECKRLLFKLFRRSI